MDNVKNFNKKIPVGVKIISILHYISSVLWAFVGFALMFGSKAIIEYISTMGSELGSLDEKTLLIVLMIIGIICIGMGVLNFFVARGLWRLKSWARTTTIVLAIIVSIYIIINIITSFVFTEIINLIINLGILVYLLFNQESKKLFKK